MIQVGGQCGQTTQNILQFVDESAIEIDIADDDDSNDCVYEGQEKGPNCVQKFNGLKKNRDDEIFDDATESNKPGKLQFLTTGSYQAVELIPPELHWKSQRSQTGSHSGISFHHPPPDPRGDRKPKGGDETKAQFVDESAVVIDIADDDCLDVVVIVDDDDDDECEGGSLFKSTAGSDIDTESDFQKDVPSTRGFSDVAASKVSPAGMATVSQDTITPVVHHSPVTRKLKRVTKSKSKSKHVSFINSEMSSFWELPQVVIDESCLEHLRKPFSFGWRRELVCRRPTYNQKQQKKGFDVYYFTPEGRRLRSMIEVVNYLSYDNNTPLNISHFTFKKARLDHPACETVRLAGSNRNKVNLV